MSFVYNFPLKINGGWESLSPINLVSKNCPLFPLEMKKGRNLAKEILKLFSEWGYFSDLLCTF